MTLRMSRHAHREVAGLSDHLHEVNRVREVGVALCRVVGHVAASAITFSTPAAA